MSYIVEYTTLSGKKVAMVHKTYERIEEAIAQATGAVKNSNYKSYKITEGHKVLPAIDRERYPEIPGLEGPFRTLNGGVVYYDPKEGAYYDKDRDMYLSYDEFRQMDTDYSGMKDERDIPVKEEDDRDELTKKLFPRKSREEMEKADKERNRKMNQQRFMKPGKPSRSREWGAYEGANEDNNKDSNLQKTNEALTLDYSRYVRSHGKKPRDTHGGGMWMFTTAEYGWPEDDDMFEFSGSFADAKRAAAKWARSKGVNRFYVMESDETINEKAPKMTGDSFKAQREKDKEHADAMGRHVKSGRKKSYTSTQRSLAQLRGEELPEALDNDRTGMKENEEPVKFNGKKFTSYKRFSSEARANAFLEKNEAYGVIGEKDGYVYVAKNADLGENKAVNEGLSDDAHHMERDHEVQMARSDLYKTANYAIKLHSILKGISEEQGLEGWMQAKITKASDYLSSVFHALEYDMVEKSQSEPIAPAESVEETTSAGGIAAVVQPMGKMIKRKKK